MKLAQRKRNQILPRSTRRPTARGWFGCPKDGGFTAAQSNAQPLTFPKWQIERCRRLHTICLSIEKAAQSGTPLVRAIRRAASTNRNRFYQCDPARPVRFGPATLYRHFSNWKKAGRSPESFRLGYSGPSSQIKFNSVHVRKFVRYATAPSVLTSRPALQRLAKTLGRSIRSMLRYLPHNVKSAVVRLHRARRAVRRAQVEIIRSLAKGTR